MDINVEARSTLAAFECRTGYLNEADVFDSLLRQQAAKALNDNEDLTFQECRQQLKTVLEDARARRVRSAQDRLTRLSDKLADHSLSGQCRELIRTFYNGALAYLCYLTDESDRGTLVLLEALRIDNYLIQEHGFWVLEMHRVQLMHNLVRTITRFDSRALGTRLLVHLLGCFSHEPAFPRCYAFNKLPLFHKTFAPQLELLPSHGAVATTAVTRFAFHEDERPGVRGQPTDPLEALFLLNFSDLSAALIRRMYGQLLTDFAKLAEGESKSTLTTWLREQGLAKPDDVRKLRAYPVGELWHTLKFDGLRATDAFPFDALRQLWQIPTHRGVVTSAAHEFHRMCCSSSHLDVALRQQICRRIGDEFEFECEIGRN